MSLFDGPATLLGVSLRPYQADCLAAIESARQRGVRNSMIVMPTGCGKTTLFASLINKWSSEPKFKALVIAHRMELLEQGAARIALQNPSLKVGIESGDSRAKDDDDVIVAGIQSIGRENCNRLTRFNPTLIITDECHHSCANSYMIAYRRYGAFNPRVPLFHLGVTATPHRMDNKPLEGSERAIYEECSFRYTLRDAVRDKWLCGIRAYTVQGHADLSQVKTTAGDYNQHQLQEAMNTTEENELAFKSWRDVAEGRRTIAFCSGIEHARDLANVFKAHGVSAGTVNGSMKKLERERVMRDFREGKFQVLTNMDIATEGFDDPQTSCILMLRPTQSWALYTQMVGRGLRLHPGKQDCIVIDVVGVTGQHSLGAAPKTGPERPSVAGIAGLPPKLDLQGHTISEAIDEYELLSESEQSSLWGRPVKFTGLRAALREVNLLSELGVPEEIASISRFQWLKTGDGVYELSCGTNNLGKKRNAELACNPIGEWELHIFDGAEWSDTFTWDSMDEAFTGAESLISEVFPGVKNIVSTQAKWRKDRPSDSQIEWLIKKNVDPKLIERMTKGEASAMLSKLFSKVNR